MKENSLEMPPILPISLDHANKVINIHLPTLDRWRRPPCRRWLRRELRGSLPHGNTRNLGGNRWRSFRNAIQPVKTTRESFLQLMVRQVRYCFGCSSEQGRRLHPPHGQYQGEPHQWFTFLRKHDPEFGGILSFDPYAIKSISYVNLGKMRRPQARVCI
jgi:hypothetical protein